MHQAFERPGTGALTGLSPRALVYYGAAKV